MSSEPTSLPWDDPAADPLADMTAIGEAARTLPAKPFMPIIPRQAVQGAEKLGLLEGIDFEVYP